MREVFHAGSLCPDSLKVALLLLVILLPSEALTVVPLQKGTTVALSPDWIPYARLAK